MWILNPMRWEIKCYIFQFNVDPLWEEVHSLLKASAFLTFSQLSSTQFGGKMPTLLLFSLLPQSSFGIKQHVFNTNTLCFFPTLLTFGFLRRWINKTMSLPFFFFVFFQQHQYLFIVVYLLVSYSLYFFKPRIINAK